MYTQTIYWNIRAEISSFLMAAYGQAASRDWECASSWRDLRKMAGIEKVVTVSYIKELVEKEAKTDREVSEILRQRYPGVESLSERSVRRYCAKNNIQPHDWGLTSVDLDNVVASAIAKVRASIYCLFRDIKETIGNCSSDTWGEIKLIMPPKTTCLFVDENQEIISCENLVVCESSRNTDREKRVSWRLQWD